jgi:hypothetical protein
MKIANNPDEDDEGRMYFGLLNFTVAYHVCYNDDIAWANQATFCIVGLELVEYRVCGEADCGVEMG